MYRVDITQPGTLKRKVASDEELDSLDSTSSDEHDSKTLDVSRYINDEVDLEVAIRERLAATIGGRIQWALQLLDALSNVKEPQDQPLDTDDFQDAALDALEAVESPSAFIFDTGFSDEQCLSSSFSPVLPNQPTFQRAPKTRSSRTPKPSQQKKHLYIKLPSTPDSQLAILVCPVCTRTQFTTLQGLLNHARLAHGIEWASHDACITACAISISADAQGQEMYERDGVEVPWGGNVVGLRRLFERAVGVDAILPTPAQAHVGLDSLEISTTPSTLLSRTLGIHADSPALAQFLGRAPKRRCIHVYDESQDVDITTLDGTGPQSEELIPEEPAQPKKGFRMRYPHRNTARKDLDLVVDIHTTAETMRSDSALAPAVVPGGTTASRFHITARIRLEDRSLLLKEDRRTQLGISDQYRWMIGITAPSYSLPLSSFLTCVTVIPPRTVSLMPLTVRQQPFGVVGTSNEPFMAKVVIEWVGGGKMEVEHWVELDQSRSYASISGSEQLLDVELDRNIPLLPVPGGSPLPLPPLDRKLPFNSLLQSTHEIDAGNAATPKTDEEYHEQVLRDLVLKVPMTAKDIKPKTTVPVSYKVVTSPAQLLGLVPGRRKAIEWGRARALHALYMEHMASVSSSRQATLTVGDIYMFLEDGSHFPRPSGPTLGPLPEPKKKKEKDRTPILGEEFCTTCGIKKRLHPGYDVKNEEDTVHWTCTVVSTVEQQYGQRFPLANLAKVFTWPNGLQESIQCPPLLPSSVPGQTSKIIVPPLHHTSRDLLTLSPPELILAVHKVISKLHLPTFPDLVTYGPRPTFLGNREDTERYLAPTALLSATIKPFVATLLRSAIEIAKRDATTIVPGAKDGRTKRTKKLTFVLTPGHVLRGLRLQPLNSLSRAFPNAARTATNCDLRVRESTALCLMQFGVRLDASEDVTTVDSEVHKTTVKAEPE